MQTVIYQCDGCGHKIKQDRSTMTARCGLVRAERGSVDLCGECSKTFLAGLTAIPQLPLPSSQKRTVKTRHIEPPKAPVPPKRPPGRPRGTATT